MTRDKAISEVRQALRDAPVLIRPDDFTPWAVVIVNILTALGVTFHEPDSVATRLHAELRHTNIDLLTVWAAIERAGLQLVNK